MPPEPISDVIVIGAGAAGLWAAEVAGRGGASVLVLEKMPRTGTKVLASGGTKCNLTTTLSGPDAAALFGRAGGRFLRTAFRVLSPEDVRTRFESWGVPTVTSQWEKVFPKTGKAVHVRDALEQAARAAGAEIRLGTGVEALVSEQSGWRVVVSGGREYRARKVILCPGGKSYPSTGTTGDGYPWLAAIGCEMVPTVPALVPLTSPEQRVRELTGIAVPDAKVRLLGANGKPVGLVRRRPVLFTHHGVSGPAPMDLSEPVAREPGSKFRLEVDLLPDASREGLRQQLLDGARAPGAPRVSQVVRELAGLPRRLMLLVCAEAGLDREPRATELGKSDRHRFVEAVKACEIAIDGTLGFGKAEVTAGGLALGEVDRGSMAVKRAPGLYACGEILDLTGPIGGLNFQAAFATAELAGRAVAEGL